MTDNEHIVRQLLRHPEMPVDPQWVTDMLKAHPTFYLPAALLLKRNPQSVDADTKLLLQRAVIINTADPTSIVDFVDPYGAGWDTFYPKEELRRSSTEQTIDEFLERFGHGTSPQEDALIEQLIFNPVPGDYFSEAEHQIDPDEPLSLPPELDKNREKAPEPENDEGKAPEPDLATIDEPIELVPEEEPETPLPETKATGAENGSEDTLLTESLVKIFIKRHNYERALDIISRLSLNYPEKSVYFADQKRFLKKLIINQQYFDKKK